MVLPLLILLLPLIGVTTAAIIDATRKGIPSEGSIFTIEGQGSQVWIVIDGERRIIDTSALELLGFDIGTTRINVIEENKADQLPIGAPVTVELIHAMMAS